MRALGKIASALVAVVGLAALAPSAVAAQRLFDWKRDTLAFSNDTLWEYGVDERGRQTRRAKSELPDYSRHCFVMCRAVLQFRKFARFDSAQPKLDTQQYRRLIRHISRIPVWMPERERKITIPGYADLRSFSTAHSGLLRDELGAWWPSYIRVGNWRMAMPFPRIFQSRLAEELARRLDRGEIQALFMTRFKPLNHCVVGYGYERLRGGDIRFWVYDPNDASKPNALHYKAGERSFFWRKSDYFQGGRVNVFKAYISPLQ
jgi:hypothetical protein